MREDKFIEIIKSVTGTKFIGDDCAYLKDIGIVISQDSLVEDIHFKMKYTSAYQLGYKSAAVNISDIAASGGEPAYMTVALSLPRSVSEEFIKNFYLGLKSAAKDIIIAGGDLTASGKIMISICIIGLVSGRKISSRSNAQNGYVIVTSGHHGSSAAGLKLLQEDKTVPEKFIKSHLQPEIKTDFSSKISQNISCDYAMMDSSDGLADALYKIAQSSSKTISVDFDKIPYDNDLKKIFPNYYKEMILYGGEDYEIIAAIPRDFALKHSIGTIIGHVEERENNIPVKIKYNNQVRYISNLDHCFKHF